MLTAVLAVVCSSAVAAWFDIRDHRIPNAIPAALLVFGAADAIRHGAQAFATFAVMLVVMLAAGTVLHAFRTVGGGDVKLIATSCAALGVHDGAVFLSSTLVAGGLLALVIAASRGRLRETLANVETIALTVAAGARPFAPRLETKMPYALAIFAGALTTALVNLTMAPR